jgi:chromosome segregation ATPase
MHNTQLARSGTQPKIRNNVKEIVDLPATPSFSFADANCIVDIEIQADQLLSYIDKLTSLADRACNTAIRQTETAQFLEKNRFTEIARLQRQLEQQKEHYQEQQLALLRVEHESKSRIASLESQLHQIAIHQRYADKDNELEILRARETTVGRQLPEERAIAKHVRKPDHSDPNPHDQDIAELRLQLAKRDETIEIKNRAIKEIEVEYRAKFLELEKRLAAAESQLELQETKLREKEAQIMATGVKEAEVGNLIKRLSAECAALNSELQEKNQRLIQIETKKERTINDATIWRRMIGRLQEEPH